MTDNMHRIGFLGRIWRFFLVTSEAAVSIHYHAPWQRTDAVRESARQANPVCGSGPSDMCPA